MSEPVYRRDEQGRLIEVTQNKQNKAPEARGKSAAMSSYLAKKGSPSGKRLDRHVQRFERMWAKADPRIKDKYAARGNSDLAPSEKKALTPPPITNASLNAARPGETSGQAADRFRANRVAKERGQTPAPVAPVAAPGEKGSTLAGPPRSAMPKPAEDTVNIGTPEERARVAEMVNEGSNFATATVGNYLDMQAAVAAERGDPDLMGVDKEIRDRNQATAKAQAEKDAAADVGRVHAKQNNARAKAGLPESSHQAQPAPVASKPPIAPYTGPMSAKFTPQAPAPTAGQPPIAGPMEVPEITGAAILKTPMSTTGKPMDPAVKSDNGAGLIRVNRLTGLPFGFQPGDAAPKAGDEAMQQRASDSQTRQSQAQAAAPTRPVAPVAGPRPMPRGPASQQESTRTSVAPVAPPRANQPDIVDRANKANANYQSARTTGDGLDAAKQEQDSVNKNLSDLDSAKLAANTMKRQIPFTQTAGAPKATAVPPIRRPMVLARR